MGTLGRQRPTGQILAHNLMGEKDPGMNKFHRRDRKSSIIHLNASTKGGAVEFQLDYLGPCWVEEIWSWQGIVGGKAERNMFPGTVEGPSPKCLKLW